MLVDNYNENIDFRIINAMITCLTVQKDVPIMENIAEKICKYYNDIYHERFDGQITKEEYMFVFKSAFEKEIEPYRDFLEEVFKKPKLRNLWIKLSYNLQHWSYSMFKSRHYLVSLSSCNNQDIITAFKVREVAYKMKKVYKYYRLNYENFILDHLDGDNFFDLFFMNPSFKMKEMKGESVLETV